jgi:mRNA interferase RelE/StbE
VNEIVFEKKAEKQLRSLPAKQAELVFGKIMELETMPNCTNIKALQGKPGYRRRAGNYRIIFQWEQTVKIVRIEQVRKRNERTYL